MYEPTTTKLSYYESIYEGTPSPPAISSRSSQTATEDTEATQQPLSGGYMFRTKYILKMRILASILIIPN